VSGQALVQGRQIIVFLLVHFLVDDILLCHTQGATGASLVNVRGSPRRLNAGLKTAITASRCRDVSTAAHQPMGHNGTQAAWKRGRWEYEPFLILFVGALCLDRTGGGGEWAAVRRHDEAECGSGE